VVILRNTLERRSELALLRAVGFSRHRLQWMTLCENWIVLVLGIACGLLAAFVAVLPAVASSGGEVPYVYMGVLIVAVVASGVLWTYLATLIATRGDLLPALRGE
jgi:putative ABC transport system permease protein